MAIVSFYFGNLYSLFLKSMRRSLSWAHLFWLNHFLQFLDTIPVLSPYLDTFFAAHNASYSQIGREHQFYIFSFLSTYGFVLILFFLLLGTAEFGILSRVPLNWWRSRITVLIAVAKLHTLMSLCCLKSICKWRACYQDSTRGDFGSTVANETCPFFRYRYIFWKSILSKKLWGRRIWSG